MICKYCKCKLEKYDCNKLSKSHGYMPITLFFLGDFFAFLGALINYKSKKEQMSKKGVVITCVNRDCIDYLVKCKKRNLLGVQS